MHLSLPLCVLVFALAAVLPLGRFTLVSGVAIYPEEDDGGSGSGDERVTSLYVGLVQSYDPTARDKQLGAVGTVVGTEIALDHINADERMLPGYRLHYNFVNSQVSFICM